MDYIRLYTVLLTHPKQEMTPPKAWKALTLAWMYAGAHETGGRIPPVARRVVGLTTSIEKELINLGWMHRNGDGWILHDWEEHQADADEIREQRERRRAQWREAKSKARKEGRAST